MKRLIIGLLAALLVACGPSTPEVEKAVATAVAESEQRLRAEWRTETIESLSTALAGTETRMMEAHAAAITASEQRIAETIEYRAYETVKAVCTSNYVTVANWTTTYWVVNHLQGGEVTLEDLSLVYDEGIPINEGYADISRVCDVDEDGRWVLVELPDEVN